MTTTCTYLKEGAAQATGFLTPGSSIWGIRETALETLRGCRLV